MFARAASYANLSPFERAVLRFLGGLFWSAFVAGLQAVMPLLSAGDVTAIPWASVLHTFIAAVTVALMLGISKYHTAQGDPPLIPPGAEPVAGAVPDGGAASVSSSSSSGAGV